jgi:murein L,D-transpeptidase YcbB/YkuD
MKKHHHALALSLLCVMLSFVIYSCGNKNAEFSKLASKSTGNKIFKDMEPEMLAEKLKAKQLSMSKSFRNPKFMQAYYEQHQYSPQILQKVFAEKRMDSVMAILDGASYHGLSPNMFNASKIHSLYNEMKDSKKVNTVDKAYDAVAELELLIAAAVSDYSNVMQFGAISPRRIYAQYYTETRRPDEKSFTAALDADDTKAYLDSIQPKAEAYLAMQSALKQLSTATSAANEEAKRILMVNLERMRWQNKPSGDKYVLVNIPDFTLDVMEKGKSALKMKVCVGEGRNKDYADKLVEYDESGIKKDRPFNRETPQLNSLIHSVQVNPVWNIPQSIASNEISKYAAADPYYLSNNNIDVYSDGKVVEDPETIDWSEEGAAKKYSFKQRPGEDNSLGKIKFLFNNQSSVYLHDTPAKSAFGLQVRAVSHGCVRVEEPMKLAQALFGNGDKFQTIQNAMKTGQPQAKDIALANKVPVYLTYNTCWLDESGKLQYRKDIYGLDIVLYTHLQKLG